MMCASFCLPTKAAARSPASTAAEKTVGTRMNPRCGCHEFQLSPCSDTSKPDSMAAWAGKVDACWMVRARGVNAPSAIMRTWVGAWARARASGRRPSSLTMTTRATREVPPAGGAAGGMGALKVTSKSRLECTIFNPDTYPDRAERRLLQQTRAQGNASCSKCTITMLRRTA